MISIIICSRQHSIPEALRDNISKTIGHVRYEIVWIDNTQNAMSIFQAYNSGVEMAQYPYLCFMHDDIIFHSTGWGEIIVRELQDNKIGLLGVIGGRYIGKTSLSWYMQGLGYGHVIQGKKTRKGYQNYLESFDMDSPINNVAAIDGLWICARKDMFTQNILRWDDSAFSGFHLYDFDISMQANSKGYSIKVLPDVTIEHTSLGTKTTEFYDAVIRFHSKWDHILPFLASGFVLPEGFSEEHLLLSEYCLMAKENYRRIHKLSHWSHKIVDRLLNLK